MSDVTIVIPTYRRPQDLARLLASIHDDLGARDDVAIVVADNDRERSAEATVTAFRTTTDRAVTYTVAEEAGVSNARNAGMAHVHSRFILFLDDDMEVVDPYLSPLLATAQDLKTAITFAPAIAALPPGAEDWDRWLAPLFSRTVDGPTRVMKKTLGTGGCLIDQRGLTLPDPVFDPSLNEVGGEDDAFFAALIDQGGTVGWCAEAKAWEHVQPHRATERYVFSRNFAFGQTPTRDAADDRKITGVILWTLVGAAQTVLRAPLYAVTRLLGWPSRIGHLGALAQGMGKMLWWDSLSPRLYGSKAR